jgi:hypothetical protein
MMTTAIPHGRLYAGALLLAVVGAVLWRVLPRPSSVEHHLLTAVPSAKAPAADTRDASLSTVPSVNHDEVVARVGRLVVDARSLTPSPASPTWIKFHGLLFFGRDGYSRSSDPPVTAEWFTGVLTPTMPPGAFTLRRGKPHPRWAPDSDRFNKEHHHDQFLHKLSMAGVPLGAQMTVEGR